MGVSEMTCRTNQLIVFVFRLNLIDSALKFDLRCQKLEHDGQYNIDGRLIVLPVEGSGDYTLMSGNFTVCRLL